MGEGRARVPCRGRPLQRSPCCLAHHSAQSAGLETQSRYGQARREWEGHNLDRVGRLPKDHGVCAGLGDWGLVGSLGRCQGMVAAILTGGPALPAGLDGVALISGGTAGEGRGLSTALPGPHPRWPASPSPHRLSLTSHSGGPCSLGHMHHTWLGHPCPGSRYLRTCGYQVDRTWGRAAMMGQARAYSPTLGMTAVHRDIAGYEAHLLLVCSLIATLGRQMAHCMEKEAGLERSRGLE